MKPLKQLTTRIFVLQLLFGLSSLALAKVPHDIRAKVSKVSGVLTLPLADDMFRYQNEDILAKTYISSSEEYGIFGLGISTHFDVTVWEYEGQYFFKTHLGKVIPFEQDGDRYISKFSSSYFMTIQNNGNFIIKDFRAKKTYHIHFAGKVYRISNLKGSIRYANLNDGIKLPSGEKIKMTKNEKGLVTSVRTLTGRVYNFSYDDNYCLTNVTYPTGLL